MNNYLTLSQACVIDKATIVGIFDLDNCTYNRRAARFINSAEPLDTDGKLPQSFIVCDTQTYLSGLTTENITKRFQTNATK
ncbi:MAG: hypothetical protein LBM98_04565 [Oscillospiraceae bacterium]|jgi:hypothetical protein|nr:hypothetical protein [Oscillospiraceae bacterium]